MKQLLKTIYMDFNFRKECFLEHECEYYAFVGSKKLPRPEDVVVRPEQVPVTCLTDQEVDMIEIPDLQQLLREIAKGEECVKKIAANLGRNIQDVSEYIRVAATYGMVAMVDLFSLRNVYVLAPTVHEFVRNEKELGRMREYCFKAENPRPTAQELLYIVLLFNRTKCVEDILKANSKVFEKVVSLVRLIRYCVLKGILRRCHEAVMNPSSSNRKFIDKDLYMKYFKSMRDSQAETDNSLENTIRQKNEELIALIKAYATLDEMCVALGLGRELMSDMLRELGVQTVLCS